MTPTAHRHLAALAFAKAHAPNAPILGVPDAGEAITAPEGVLVVEKRGGVHSVRTEEWEQWEWTLDSPIPFDTPGALVVSYMYRDASNYKTRGTASIMGPFSRADLAVLIGALTAGDDRCFIPHQVGLPDLQEQMSGETDFGEDGDDHVWHTLEALGWRAVKTADHTWAEIGPRVRERLDSGYDIVAAIQELEGGFY